MEPQWWDSLKLHKLPQSKKDIAIILSRKSLSLTIPENKQTLDELLVEAKNKNNRNKSAEIRMMKLRPIDRNIRKFGVTVLDNDRSRESVREAIAKLQNAKKITQSKEDISDKFGTAF